MTLLRTTVEEAYDGLRVLTDKTVLIEDSTIQKTYGAGIYLEDADGTTLRNVQIQTNEISITSSFSAESQDSSDYRQTQVFSASGGALFIKGGNPKIDGVYVSANGTVTVNVKLDKYGYYYMYMYLHVYVPIVGIDSDEMTSVSGIHVRDSKINVNVRYTCVDHWTYPYAYWYLYTTATWS
jgi:parallel beta-helix repeat protein